MFRICRAILWLNLGQCVHIQPEDGSKSLNMKLRAVNSQNTGLSKKMDGIWNRYNLKSTGRIYTFGVLKCSEKFKVLDLP